MNITDAYSERIHEGLVTWVTYTRGRQQPYAVWIHGRIWRFTADRIDAINHALRYEGKPEL